jgi:organic radical activating enzyme
VSTANLFEVFSGIQGEGLRVGERHLFVRFSGCNLSCSYCDTLASHQPSPVVQIEDKPGRRRFTAVKNPLTVDELVAHVERLDAERRHRAIALTGGEPLLAADFIAAFAPRCGGRPLLLETNGTLPDELRKVIDRVAVVAMDIKLREVAGVPTDLSVSRAFLRIAARRDVCVKIVVSNRADTDAVMDAALVVASVDRTIPLVIQPVTPPQPDQLAPTPEQLLAWQMTALSVLDDVRVLPQVHRLMEQK